MIFVEFECQKLKLWKTAQSGPFSQIQSKLPLWHSNFAIIAPSYPAMPATIAYLYWSSLLFEQRCANDFNFKMFIAVWERVDQYVVVMLQTYTDSTKL